MSGKTGIALIVAKRNNAEAESAALRVAGILKSRKLQVYCAAPLKLEGCLTKEPEQLENLSPSFVIAIGGDGTTLRAFRMLPGGAPILSVNIGGHRGILSEVGIDSLEEGMLSMLDGKCSLDRRMRLEAQIGKKRLPPALNDILITRKSVTRTPVLSIRVMNDEIVQRMDGLLISTPTGSTGHSMSIGGPVIHESMDCIIMSPIAPINRIPPLVIPSEPLSVSSNQECHVVIDGQESFELPLGQSVRLSKHESDACFLRIKKEGLRQFDKLGF